MFDIDKIDDKPEPPPINLSGVLLSVAAGLWKLGVAGSIPASLTGN